MDDAAKEILTLLQLSSKPLTIPKNLGEDPFRRKLDNRSQALRWIAASVGPIRPIWCCSLGDLLPLFLGLSQCDYRGCRFELICENEMRHWVSLIVVIDQQGGLTTIAIDALLYCRLFSLQLVTAIQSQFANWTRYRFISDGIYAPIQGRSIGCRVIALELCRRLQLANTSDLIHGFDVVSSSSMSSSDYQFSLASILAKLNAIEDSEYQHLYAAWVLFSLAERSSQERSSCQYIADNEHVKSMLHHLIIPGTTATLFDALVAPGHGPVIEAEKNMSNNMEQQLEKGPKTDAPVRRHQLDLIDPLACMQMGVLLSLQQAPRPHNAFDFLHCVMTAMESHADTLLDDPNIPLPLQLRLFRYLVEDKQYKKAYQLLLGNEHMNDLLMQCHQPWQLKRLIVIAANHAQWRVALYIIRKSPMGLRTLQQRYVEADDCDWDMSCLIPLFDSQEWSQLKEEATLLLTVVELAQSVGVTRLPSDTVRLDVIQLELKICGRCHLLLQLPKEQRLYHDINNACTFSLVNLNSGFLHRNILNELLSAMDCLLKSELDSIVSNDFFCDKERLLSPDQRVPERTCCAIF